MYRIGITTDREPNNSVQDLEVCVGESQTIPNQTIPLNELVMRYQKGMPLPRINDYGSYQEDDLGSEPTFNDTIVRTDVDITEVTEELSSIKAKKQRAVADLGNAKKRTEPKPKDANGENGNG